jgi:hypothetical protein
MKDIERQIVVDHGSEKQLDRDDRRDAQARRQHTCEPETQAHRQ